MPDFEDDFDGEVNGTPPDNWDKDGAAAPGTLDISNADCVSNPNSCRCITQAGTNGYYHNKTGKFTVSDDRPLSLALKFIGSTSWRQLMTQAVEGNVSGGDLTVSLYFDTVGGSVIGSMAIGLYNGSAYVDSGEIWAANTWFTIKIEHDFGNDEFDAWYNDTNLFTNGDFRTSQSQVKTLQILCQKGVFTSYMDDVQVGETTGWTGNIIGTTDPTKVNPVAVANISEINGVA